MSCGWSVSWMPARAWLCLRCLRRADSTRSATMFKHAGSGGAVECRSALARRVLQCVACGHWEVFFGFADPSSGPCLRQTSPLPHRWRASMH
jgi:hypothetical protein